MKSKFWRLIAILVLVLIAISIWVWHNKEECCTNEATTASAMQIYYCAPPDTLGIPSIERNLYEWRVEKIKPVTRPLRVEPKVCQLPRLIFPQNYSVKHVSAPSLFSIFKLI